MPYAILLNQLQDLDLHKTASILARAENIIYADATRAVRHCSGFLAKDLSYQEAKMITDELNRAGIGSFFMDMKDIYYPPEQKQIFNADCIPDFFSISDIYGRTTPVFWDNIILISVGRITEQKRERYTLGTANETAQMIEDAGRAITGSWFTVPTTTSDSFQQVGRRKTKVLQFLDIFSKAPQEGHYRIESSSFNYDYLRSRLKPNSDENFKLLVEDLSRYSTKVYGNRGTTALLTGKKPQDIIYQDVRRFDEENLWLLQLIYLNLRRKQTGQTGEQK